MDCRIAQNNVGFKKVKGNLMYSTEATQMRHANQAERVTRRQEIVRELMTQGWDYISASVEASDREEIEEAEIQPPTELQCLEGLARLNLLSKEGQEHLKEVRQ